MSDGNQAYQLWREYLEHTDVEREIGGVGNGDAKEVMDIVKITHAKLMLKRVDDEVKKSCGVSNEYNVVNINK